MPSTWKNISSGSPSAEIGSPWLRSQMLLPPRMPKVITHTRVGIVITYRTNSRSVLPREIFARKMPTKGDQEIHHAQ